MKRIVLVTAAAGGRLGACASSSDKVAATYISPIQYSSLTGPQIREESARVANRASIASGVQDDPDRCLICRARANGLRERAAGAELPPGALLRGQRGFRTPIAMTNLQT